MSVSHLSESYVFLTGATGLLGRYLLRDLLMAGRSVAVLARSTRKLTARQRVEAILKHWESELGHSLPRPIILEGDISEPNLGLDEVSLDWVTKHVDSFLHNAASLTFHATSKTSEPWRSNVVGVDNVLEFCRKTNIFEFHHVSTAYTCGLRTDTVLETDLDVGQKLGNDYEASKIQAEKLVSSTDFLQSVTIYRPAIIIGDSVTGYTTTFHGFYVPLQLVHTLAGSMSADATGRVCATSRLSLRNRDRKNLVPVDWVSAVTAHILLHPEHHGKTYHLTPRHPVTAAMLRDVLVQCTNIYEVLLVGEEEVTDRSEAELLFHQNMQVYNSYWRDDPTFDSSQTQQAAPHLPCPHIDRTMLIKLAQWAIKSNFGGGRQKPVEPDFDPVEFLGLEAKTADNLSGKAFGLQIDGSHGGQWHLIWNEGRLVDKGKGLTKKCLSRIHMNSETLEALVRGALTSENAIREGSIAFRGNGLSDNEQISLIDQLTRSRLRVFPG